MKSIQLGPMILLVTQVSATWLQPRTLQGMNVTATNVDGDVEVVTMTVEPTKSAAEVEPTDANVTEANATDGGFLAGVGDWVGDAANTVQDTVVNATGGFTDWLGNLVGGEDKELTEDAGAIEESTAADSEGTGGSSGMVRLVSAYAFAASAASIINLL